MRNLYRYIVSSFLSLLLFTGLAHAEASGPFYFDLNGSGGSTTTNVSTGQSKPTIVTWSIGTTVGFNYADFGFLGLSADYQFINQTSAVDTAVGNRSGKRMNISPTLGFRFSMFVIKADIVMMGDYVLNKQTTSSETVTYKEPSGFKATILYGFSESLYFGLVYESLAFAKEVVGSTEATLTDKRTLQTTGLAAAFMF